MINMVAEGEFHCTFYSSALSVTVKEFSNLKNNPKNVYL
jgi:hypothetical protein